MQFCFGTVCIPFLSRCRNTKGEDRWFLWAEEGQGSQKSQIARAPSHSEFPSNSNNKVTTSWLVEIELQNRYFVNVLGRLEFGMIVQQRNFRTAWWFFSFNLAYMSRFNLTNLTNGMKRGTGFQTRVPTYLKQI